MPITRSSLKFPADYKLCNSPLESISCHKYLGFFIQHNLEWDSHVKSVKHTTMKVLPLLRINFSGSSQYVIRSKHKISCEISCRICLSCLESSWKTTHKSVWGCQTLRFKICLFWLFTIFKCNVYTALAGRGHSWSSSTSKLRYHNV